MSKLPKAPLIEVVFELRWMITDPQDNQNIQYLPGDLYPKIKEKYPHREPMQGIPIFGQTIASRFRTAENEYPLIQIGPGIFTVNTSDAKYFWKEYEAEVIDVIGKLNEVYVFKDSHNATLTLRYIDFIKFDFSNDDVLKFLNEKLHINVSQGFYETNSLAKNVVLSLNFDAEFGSLNVAINQGKNILNEDGIIIQTNIAKNIIKPETEKIKLWLDGAHEVCSNVFKHMTKGYLQEFFAS